MRNTPEGIRILKGAEAELFREGLADLVFHLDEYDDDEDAFLTHSRNFDLLATGSKFAMLESVGRALLRKSIPPPMQTAISESSIAAVFYHVKSMVAVEIDEKTFTFRRLIRNACLESKLTDELPKLRSTDSEAWWESVEGLMERIFWDFDFEDDIISMDLDPSVAHSQGFCRNRRRLLHDCCT